MLREQTFDKLYGLKLHGLAAALEEQLKDPEISSLGFEERLGMLVDAQWLWRENLALTRRLRQARLASHGKAGRREAGVARLRSARDRGARLAVQGAARPAASG